ncbi:MAG: hypothetical protein J7M38_14465, partial [Armatimonadetes bacterium]|nr:hypothetical protein [Armatimonadota bacterium]
MLDPNGDAHAMVGIVATRDIALGYEKIDVETMVRQVVANIGGMGQFVHRGQVVLIKPNAVIDASPTT